MQSVDMGTVIANTLFGFTFSGMLVLLALLAVGTLWCMVPFAVFGVKKRLDGIEVAQHSQTEMLIGELKRINENLRQRVSAVGTAEPQPVARPRFERVEMRNAAIDAEMQAAMDAVEHELAARMVPQPVPAHPAVRPVPARSPAYANAAATMFGQRPPTLNGALAQNRDSVRTRDHGMARPVIRSALQFSRA